MRAPLGAVLNGSGSPTGALRERVVPPALAAPGCSPAGARGARLIRGKSPASYTGRGLDKPAPLRSASTPAPEAANSARVSGEGGQARVSFRRLVGGASGQPQRGLRKLGAKQPLRAMQARTSSRFGAGCPAQAYCRVELCPRSVERHRGLSGDRGVASAPYGHAPGSANPAIRNFCQDALRTSFGPRVQRRCWRAPSAATCGLPRTFAGERGPAPATGPAFGTPTALRSWTPCSPAHAPAENPWGRAGPVIAQRTNGDLFRD